MTAKAEHAGGHAVARVIPDAAGAKTDAVARLQRFPPVRLWRPAAGEYMQRQTAGDPVIRTKAAEPVGTAAQLDACLTQRQTWLQDALRRREQPRRLHGRTAHCLALCRKRRCPAPICIHRHIDELAAKRLRPERAQRRAHICAVNGSDAPAAGQ